MCGIIICLTLVLQARRQIPTVEALKTYLYQCYYSDHFEIPDFQLVHNPSIVKKSEIFAFFASVHAQARVIRVGNVVRIRRGMEIPRVPPCTPKPRIPSTEIPLLCLELTQILNKVHFQWTNLKNNVHNQSFK